MSEFDIFLLSSLNFLLLLGLILFSSRRPARQFFYARHMGLRKEMISAGRIRRKARLHLLHAHQKMEGLPEDILRRRAALAAARNAESEAFLATARQHADRIVRAAARQVDEERAKDARELRTRLIHDAFTAARQNLRDTLSAEAHRRILDRGFGEVRALLRSRPPADSGESSP